MTLTLELATFMCWQSVQYWR